MKSKRILCVVLSVAIVLTMTFGLIPTIVYASGPDIGNIDTWAKLSAAVNAAPTNDTLYTIDISGNFNTDNTVGTINIGSGKNILIESASGGPYSITRDSAFTRFLLNVYNSANLTLKSITLDGNAEYVTPNFGMVYIFNGGKFTMDTGATIQNEKGDVGGNSAGVCVETSGTMTMKAGAAISNVENINVGDRGALFVEGTLNMEGGSVAGCKGINGGVASSPGSTINLSGGSVTGNTCNYGGINVDGTINISGAPNISGNKKADGTTPCNVFLWSGSVITVAESFNPTTPIGITTGSTPSASSPANITVASDHDWSSYFTSDNPSYIIQNSGIGSSQIVQLAVRSTTIDVGDSSGANLPTGVTYDGTNHLFSIDSGANNSTITVIGSNSTSTNTIAVATGVSNLTLILNNVGITSPSGGKSPIDLQGNANVTIQLASGTTNTLNASSAVNMAGLCVPSTATVTINGAGSLTATGGADSANPNSSRSGAGIGGGANESGGNIHIVSGMITANGGNDGNNFNAAGIGGGSFGSGGNITIDGGTIVATAGVDGAGIGGGDRPTASNGTVINITGGNITANGNYSRGAAIGGGSGESGCSVTISGGSVYADMAAGAGIGTGYGAGNTHTITISGGTVEAYGGGASAGIGGSYNSSAGNISITGGNVTAGGVISGIGGGSNASGGTIRIDAAATVKAWTLSGSAVDTTATVSGSANVLMANFTERRYVATPLGPIMTRIYDKSVLPPSEYANINGFYKSIAFTVPVGSYQLKTGGIMQHYAVDASTKSTNFAVSSSGVTQFNSVEDDISPLASFTPVTLTQTGDIAHNNVQYTNVAAVIAVLPTTVSVTLVNGSVVNVPVTWSDPGTYDAGTAGTYTFTASWGTLPAGANNDNSLAAPTVGVTVSSGSVAPTIKTASLADGTVGTAYSQTFVATGTAPITWSITGGKLPNGLILNPATGAIIGTPNVAGASTFTVQASNSNGSTTKSLSITVNATQTAPTGLLGVAPTTYGGADGTIIGVTTAMEYKRIADTNYTKVTGTTIIGLVAGTYNVRYAAKTGYSASADATVIVPDGQEYHNNGGGGGSISVPTPVSVPITIVARVISDVMPSQNSLASQQNSTTQVSTPIQPNAAAPVIKPIAATVTAENDGTKTASLKASDAVTITRLDGTQSALTDMSKVSFTLPVVTVLTDATQTTSTITPAIVAPAQSVSVAVAQDGTLSVKGLANNTESRFAVTYDLGNGQHIAIGTMDVKVSSTGDVDLTSTLIDPYGIVTDSSTGNALSGVNVQLFYANTPRNIANNKTPDILVNLPEINGFKPSNNVNPQISDVLGEYGFMVFPSSDYYVVATKDGYNKYISPAISVEQAIVKWDFTMNKTNLVKPTITLNGDAAVSIKVNDKYIDLGAKAVDSYGADLTRQITTSGAIDTTKLGDYTETYSVADAIGNQNSVTRTIHVINTTKPILVLNGDADVKTVMNSTYSDLGASATDNTGNNITSSIKVTGSVDTSTVGDYKLIYDVADSNGIVADSVTRTVHVIAKQVQADTTNNDTTKQDTTKINTIGTDTKKTGVTKPVINKPVVKKPIAKKVIKSIVIGVYTDSISGSVLAAKTKGIAMAAKDYKKIAAIKSVATVYILGGTQVMDKATEKAIKGYGIKNIIRLGGANAYETSALIAKYLRAETGKPVVLLSSKTDKDLIKAVIRANKANYTIALTNGNKLNEFAKRTLQSIKPSKIYVVAGIAKSQIDVVKNLVKTTKIITIANKPIVLN